MDGENGAVRRAPAADRRSPVRARSERAGVLPARDQGRTVLVSFPCGTAQVRAEAGVAVQPAAEERDDPLALFGLVAVAGHRAEMVAGNLDVELLGPGH